MLTLNNRSYICLNMIITSILVLLLSVCNVLGNVTCTTCTQQEICTAYLDAAIEMITKGKYFTAVNMITKAKYHIPSDNGCTHCPNDCTKCPNDCKECPTKECPKTKPVDCADLLNMGHNKSGVYQVWPTNRATRGKPITVYCDMKTDGGGWLVIQRRGDFGSAKDYFYREWSSYKEGFGNLEKDFWLGNDNIFVLTNEKYYSARFDLMDVYNNKRYAQYDNFWIDNEDCKYTLHITNYSGDAGDAMIENNNQAFSTKDRRNDRWKKSCATERKAAWWYNACTLTNLNGLYHNGKYQGSADGVYWQPWKGSRESLKWTEIKIRPKHFITSFRL